VFFGQDAFERAQRLPFELRIAMLLAAGVFAAALFLLVWKQRYARFLEDLERAASQSTAVITTSGRLLIETSGPLGPLSVTIRSDENPSLLIRRHPFLAVPCLLVTADDSKRATLFPGLSHSELRWVANELRLALTSIAQPLTPTTTMSTFNGLGLHLGNLHQLSNAKTRSISAENFTGEKGKAGMATEGTGAGPSRELGRGWKVSPSIVIKSKEEREIANIAGPGAIQQIWMTPTGNWRWDILRIYWDDSPTPSVECPVGDFFANGWGKYAPISSLPVCVNPGSAFNCYWTMPFRKRCRITMQNLDEKEIVLYYQINYTLTDVPEDAAYFHAQFRRVNPLPYKQVYTILDKVSGRGHYVGTYLAWGVNNNGWWGEGEIKFFMDGDGEFPTICGTGTEDYFCGSYDFDVRRKREDGIEINEYQEFTTPYSGLAQVLRGDGHYQVQQRFGLYRWHIMDPIRFEQDLRVTIQALGWRSGGRYLPLQDDIASVAYWYQTPVAGNWPKLMGKDELEIV
jgi:hypothetical protein